MLIEVLDIFIPNGFELLRATDPNESDDEFETSTGYGDVPVNTTDTFPPSETTFTVSVNDPKNVGLNFTVNIVLSCPAIVDELLVAVKLLVLIVILLIDIALIEVFLKYAVIVAESPLARLLNVSDVTDTPNTGAGLFPLNGIFTSVVCELFRKYKVSINEPIVVGKNVTLNNNVSVPILPIFLSTAKVAVFV